MSDQNPGIEFAEKKKKTFDQMASMHFILNRHAEKQHHHK